MATKKSLINASNVAEYFLSLTEPEAGDIMSNLKLQKLVYYAQGYHLALFNKEFFSDEIEAWEHGPVVPQLYHCYKQYGSGAIAIPENIDSSVFSKDQISLIKEIYQVLGQYSGWKLRNMTHEESPWKDTDQGEVITKESMKKYFTFLMQGNK